MLSRLRHSLRSTHVRIEQPLPSVVWLPPELIILIWTFLSPETTSYRSLVDLARVCQGWHGPAMACIYASVAPTSLTSCKLLIRTLDNDPNLSDLIRTLTIPMDNRLFTLQVSGAKGRTITQRLVAKCTSLSDLRIPMDSALLWTDGLLKTNLPHMAELENLKNLTISAFNTIDPCQPRDIAAQYVSMWLCQVSVLPRLESMTLSGVAFSPESADRPCQWPRMPYLHRLHFDRPFWCTLGDTPNLPLLPHVIGSLKALHITGFFERGPHVHPASQSRFGHATSLLLSTTLEELVLTRPAPYYPTIRDQWLRNGLEHMVSLRHLHISEWMFHPGILIKPPPLLETLTITMHCGGGSRFNIRGLLPCLPLTVKTLTIRARGFVWETDVDDIAVGSKQPTHRYPDIQNRATLLKREMYQIADYWGIDFQIQDELESSWPAPTITLQRASSNILWKAWVRMALGR